MVKYDTNPDHLKDQLSKKIGAPTESIADVRVVTTMKGASSLEVDIIDPDFAILETGRLCPVNRKIKTTNPTVVEAERDAGHGPYHLPHVEVNYPEGSRFWWRLSDVEVDSDADGPNILLTFETRIIAYLRGHHGPPVKSMRRDHGTRARFIKWLADEVKANGGIVFVCEELKDKQPILETDPHREG